ncbi:helix-turn-helix domain-containing protein [Niallia nealsonii]|uniref:XRE family transcriptional regulator n=1 Tax=Niallia nealsonii TaxID=115979 RepID=A0A2N0YX84_9BACI|nr:helix-turn-helix transcriptional regulator [Niallia nealsonii]PKG21860.1 XRE family transcriptional regulator [Niallia nealsonii]
MITNEKAFENGQYKQRGLLINLDKLPMHKQIAIKRVHDGLSQTRLAEMLGLCDSSALSRIEYGRRAIPIRIMENLEKYLYEETYLDGILQESGENR